MQRPERPQELNGDAGHLWTIIEYTLDRFDLLEKRFNQLFLTILIGLMGIIGALAAVALSNIR